ncbi:hypothetical protein KY084_04035 [Stakelama sp. CBK3Z-3]|uniref:Uncharacterized protein n=1 Tax=Stakelama flava TaxID=2860338 RepID=A0ABS6XIN9_9SPHN|nr:hypothetical protein [Stakelama flava]MBW4330042.1 hypothetical protein [Stakelama flava]
MTDDPRTTAIDLCRQINRSAAIKYAEQGVPAEQIATAAIYSAFDIAEGVTGNGANAIEFLRTHLDQMEARIMETM